MEQKQNTRYIYRLFLPVLSIVTVMFVFFLVDAIKNNSHLFYISFLGILVLIEIVVGYLAYKWANQRVSKALQSKTPQDLISIFERKSLSLPGTRLIMSLYSKIIPGLKSSEVFSISLAYTYWGQYDLARQELRKVKWENQPPIYQSLEKYIQSLHCYLEMRDYPNGLELAENSYLMVQVGRIFPFRNWLNRGNRSLVEIGKVLCGDLSSDAVAALEAGFKRNRLMIRNPIAWALEKAYIQIGDTQKANQMRAFLNATAPYCAAFAN